MNAQESDWLDRKFKVVLVDWRKNGATQKAFEELKYEDNSDHEMTGGTILYVAQQFLQYGMNVMILDRRNGHVSDEFDYLLAIGYLSIQPKIN
jgi:hypothetical protein